MKTFTLIALIFTMSQAGAWGGRGHATICEVAPFLVKNEGLKSFVTFRPQVMAHLCNVPDIYWKSLAKEITSEGNPAHYIDSEILGLAIKDIPLDYSAIVKNYTGKISAFEKNVTVKDVPKEVGSLWWRADQMMRLGTSQKTVFENATFPVGREQEQDNKLPYNQAVYNWMVYMGVLGHYIGDASMPYHNSADHDGWQAGHGGIHFYYEDAVVGEFGPDLHKRIADKAREIAKQPGMMNVLKHGTTLEKMRAFSALNFADMAKVNKLDPISKKSSEVMVDGKTKKNSAERKGGPKAGYALFNKMIVEQMARSALLLANLWDTSYEEAGKPDLSKYRSFQYPFQPEFIPLDYVSKDAKTSKVP